MTEIRPSVAVKTDSRPFLVALGIATLVLVAWLGFRYVGEQRYHNTRLWQSWRPVTLVSPPQAVLAVEVRDRWRNSLATVRTEKGLYFVGDRSRMPSVGQQVVVQANDHWELYLCDAGGAACTTIHSFCAGGVSPDIHRDARGRAEGCHAPYTGENVAAAPEPPAVEASRGPGKRSKRLPPPVGMSHPREWAGLMGLPVDGHREGAGS